MQTQGAWNEPWQRPEPARLGVWQAQHLFNAAKQFVGWYVGERMRQAGYHIDKPSKAVPGKLFNVGAVWVPN